MALHVNASSKTVSILLQSHVICFISGELRNLKGGLQNTAPPSAMNHSFQRELTNTIYLP